MKCGSIGLVLLLTFAWTGCSNQGNSYYKAAQKSYRQGDYKIAAEQFEQAIEANGNRAEYYLDYGYCLIQNNDYEKAKTVFESVVMDKENTIVQKNNEKAYRGLGIAEYLEGDFEASLQAFNQAIQFASSESYELDILMYMGAANMQLAQFQEAEKSFSEVLKRDSKHKMALKLRGEVYARLGRYEDSIKDYSAAKRIDPKDYDVYFGLYEVYKQQNDNENARNILDEATSLPIKDAKDQFYLAKAHYLQEDLAQAKEGFELASAQGITESYLYLGDIAFTQGEMDTALTYYKQYETESASKSSSMYERLATCYMQLEAYDQALAAAQTGLLYTGENERKVLLKTTVIAYEHLGDYVNALKYMEEYVALYSDDEAAIKEYEYIKTRQGLETNREELQGASASNQITKP